MNNTEKSDSKPGSSNIISIKKQRKDPNCTRCANHGLTIRTKEHKRYCKYRYCICEQCQITMERQMVQAKQIALARGLKLDLEKKLLPEETRPLPYGINELLLKVIKQQDFTKKREDNFEILLLLSLERMRHFSFAQPFSFCSTLLNIILHYAKCPKKDLKEATFHLYQAISEMEIRLGYYDPVLLATPPSMYSCMYDRQLYPIKIGIPPNPFQPIMSPPNTPVASSTLPCTDQPPSETPPASYCLFSMQTVSSVILVKRR